MPPGQGYTVGRRRVEGSGQSSLYAGDGNGNGVYQDSDGRRFDQRRVAVPGEGNVGISIPRDDVGRGQRPSFDRHVGAAEEYGQRELKDGEFEALMPGDRPQRGRSVMQDLDGDGVPDGAEVKLTRTAQDAEGRETRAEATFRKTAPQVRPQDRPIPWPQPNLQDPDRLRGNRDRLNAFTASHSRNTEGGQTASERILGDRAKGDRRQHELNRIEGQFVAPERERQRGAGERADADRREQGRQFDENERQENEQFPQKNRHDREINRDRYVRPEQERQWGANDRADADRREEGRQFDETERNDSREFSEKNKPRIFKDKATGERVFTYNGQAVKLGRPDSQGVEPLEIDGKVVGFMGRDGIPRFRPLPKSGGGSSSSSGGSGPINASNFADGF
tara:strand:- start:3591 stop:4769 length:1179 start_codon:yes stop_codon:yes gene_type:complete